MKKIIHVVLIFKFYLYFVILVGIAYAFIDELHQSIVLNRYGSAKDILIDSIGVYLAIWVYKCRVVERLFKRKTKKQLKCS